MNRSVTGFGTTIKLLHWERGGLGLYHKRLERGRFSLPLFDGKGAVIIFSGGIWY